MTIEANLAFAQSRWWPQGTARPTPPCPRFCTASSLSAWSTRPPTLSSFLLLSSQVHNKRIRNWKTKTKNKISSLLLLSLQVCTNSGYTGGSPQSSTAMFFLSPSSTFSNWHFNSVFLASPSAPCSYTHLVFIKSSAASTFSLWQHQYCLGQWQQSSRDWRELTSYQSQQGTAMVLFSSSSGPWLSCKSTSDLSLSHRSHGGIKMFSLWRTGLPLVSMSPGLL